MGCPENTILEALMAGRLPEAEAAPVRAHVAQCVNCRKEFAFLSATRLSLPSSPLEGCLSDEILCLFRDELLPEKDRTTALAHLRQCGTCLRSLVTLDRALEESAKSPADVPEALLQKAIAIGAPTAAADQNPERVSWLVRLLQGPASLRIAVAGAAAALVLILFVLFPGTKEPAKPGPSEPLRPTVATPTPAPQQQLPAPPSHPVVTPVPTEPDKPVVALPGSVPKPGEPTPTPSTHPALPVDNPKTIDGWLAAMPEVERRALVGKLRPSLPSTEALTGQALDERDDRKQLQAGFSLGQASLFLKTFAGQVGNWPEQRKMVAETARSLAPLLRQALAGDPAQERMTAFTDNLARLISDGTPSASTRAEVLSSALGVSVAPRKQANLGYRLGQLSSQMKLLAAALDQGERRQDFLMGEVDLPGIQRDLAGAPPQLSKESQAELNASLSAISKILKSPPDDKFSSELLREIQRLDNAVGSSR